MGASVPMVSSKNWSWAGFVPDGLGVAVGVAAGAGAPDACGAVAGRLNFVHGASTCCCPPCCSVSDGSATLERSPPAGRYTRKTIRPCPPVVPSGTIGIVFACPGPTSSRSVTV